MNSRTTCIGLLLFVLGMPAPAISQEFGHDTAVIDDAGVIDQPTRTVIDRCLLELEKKTGAQVRVLTINSTKGRDIHDYAIEVAKKQKDRCGQKTTGLGQAGKNNGVLIVVAVKDRRYRIEVGEGLEGALPDLYCDSIAQSCFVPNFRRGDFGTGICDGAVAVAQKIAAEAGVQLQGTPAKPKQLPTQQTARPGPGGVGAPAGFCVCVPLFPILIIFLIVASLASRRRRYCRTWGYGGYGGGGFWQGMLLGSLLNQMGGHSHGGHCGGSSWGGGFGGGGFGGGGFSGGGGGSFGGGGASGGW